MKITFKYIKKWLGVQIGLAILFGIFPLSMPTQDGQTYMSYSSMLTVDSNYLNTAAAAMGFYFGLLLLSQWWKGGFVEEMLRLFKSILEPAPSIISGLFKMIFWWHAGLYILSLFKTMPIDRIFQMEQASMALGISFLIDTCFLLATYKGVLNTQYGAGLASAAYRPIKDVQSNKKSNGS